MCSIFVPGSLEGQNRISVPLGLELTVSSYYDVGSGNPPWSLCQEEQVPGTTERSHLCSPAFIPRVHLDLLVFSCLLEPRLCPMKSNSSCK